MFDGERTKDPKTRSGPGVDGVKDQNDDEIRQDTARADASDAGEGLQAFKEKGMITPKETIIKHNHHDDEDDEELQSPSPSPPRRSSVPGAIAVRGPNFFSSTTTNSSRGSSAELALDDNDGIGDDGPTNAGTSTTATTTTAATAATAAEAQGQQQEESSPMVLAHLVEEPMLVVYPSSIAVEKNNHDDDDENSSTDKSRSTRKQKRLCLILWFALLFMIAVVVLVVVVAVKRMNDRQQGLSSSPAGLPPGEEEEPPFSVSYWRTAYGPLSYDQSNDGSTVADSSAPTTDEEERSYIRSEQSVAMADGIFVVGVRRSTGMDGGRSSGGGGGAVQTHLLQHNGTWKAVNGLLFGNSNDHDNNKTTNSAFGEAIDLATSRRVIEDKNTGRSSTHTRHHLIVGDKERELVVCYQLDVYDDDTSATTSIDGTSAKQEDGVWERWGNVISMPGNGNSSESRGRGSGGSSRFGSVVAMSSGGARVVVGAPDADVTNGTSVVATNAGCVYTFEYVAESNEWKETGSGGGGGSRLCGSGDDERLGTSMAMTDDGQYLLVGGWGTFRYHAWNSSIYSWTEIFAVRSRGEDSDLGRDVAIISEDGAQFVVTDTYSFSATNSKGFALGHARVYAMQANVSPSSKNSESGTATYSFVQKGTDLVGPVGSERYGPLSTLTGSNGRLIVAPRYGGFHAYDFDELLNDWILVGGTEVPNGTFAGGLSTNTNATTVLAVQGSWLDAQIAVYDLVAT